MASPRDGGTSWTRPALALAATCAIAFACGAAGLVQRAPSSPSPSTPTAGSAAPPATCPGEPGEDGATSLERAVRDAVQDAGFDEVIDLGPTDDPVTLLLVAASAVAGVPDLGPIPTEAQAVPLDVDAATRAYLASVPAPVLVERSRILSRARARPRGRRSIRTSRP